MTFATYTYEHQAMLQLEQMAADQQDTHFTKQQQENNIDFLEVGKTASGLSLGSLDELSAHESESGVGGREGGGLSLDVESALQVGQEPEMHSVDSSIDIATQMALEAVTEAAAASTATNSASASSNGAMGVAESLAFRHHLPMSNDNTAIRSSVGSIDFDTITSASSSTFMHNEYQTFTDPTASVGSAATIVNKSSRVVDDIAYIMVDTKYQCPREGCGKMYKNKNGLKYHLQKGLCTGSFEVVGADGKYINREDSSLFPTPDQSKSNSPRHTKATRLRAEDFANDPEAYARYKPFWCRQCSKRYKNINGLKYHAKVDHAEFEFDDIKGMSQPGPIYSAEQIRIPPELPEILKNYAKYIIKNQPEDIVGSSATYFTKLLNQTKQAGKDGKLVNAQLVTFLKKCQVGKPIVTKKEIQEACEWADVSDNQRDDTLSMGGWVADQVPWMHFFGFLVASVGGNFQNTLHLVITLASDNGLTQAALFRSVFSFLAEQDKAVNPDFVSAVTDYLSKSGPAILTERMSAKINELWENPFVEEDAAMASSDPAPEAAVAEDAEMLA